MRILMMLIGLGVVLGSCEKIIEIDLNTANPNIVVESELYRGVRDFEVKLSYTSSFFKEEEQAIVDNAIVSLMEEGGEMVSVDYAGEGIYKFENYEAKNDKTYTLSIDLDGVNYSSTASMPAFVPLDSLRQMPAGGGPFGGEGEVVFMHWKDDPNELNFYRVIYTLNDTIRRDREDVFIFDDNFTNGNETMIPLFVRTFSKGDTIDVQFLSIDPKAYDYLLTLNTIIGNGQPSAAPANPNSNFTNGALGYFAVYNGDEKRIIIE